MICPGCGKNYNHLQDLGVVGNFCSRACASELVAYGYAQCIHGFISRRCVTCLSDKDKIVRPATAEDKIEQIKKIFKAHQCGDSSCIYGRPGGQMTNGGCMSLKDSTRGQALELQRLVMQLRHAIEGTTIGDDPKKEKPLPSSDRFDKLDID